MPKLSIKTNQQGTITPALLAISGAFMVVIYALLFILSLQLDVSNRQVLLENSLHIAEAGVNYYRWHLAHDPDDFQDGTGGPGPYEHEYVDPQGDAIGKFSLEITPPTAGTSVVTIKSTGWTYKNPKIKRAVNVQYGQPSWAKYAFLQNSSSWYAEGVIVNGQIHSNNGVRMDETNHSLVTSAKDEYMCGWETGCSPPETKPGVWGSGGDSGLWQFPVPPVDFDSISFDLAQMRDTAIADGLYLPPSGDEGYRIEFFDDGTFTVDQVESTKSIRGYQVPGEGLGHAGKGGCRHRYQIIKNETPLGTYNVSDIPVVFAEDYLWVEGTVKGRITVATATFPIGSSNVDIWIKDNLVYTTQDGSDALGLISQNDIYFVRDVPNDFKVDAIIMSQFGSILRHGYFNWCGGVGGAVKNKLTINGGLISYAKSYWNFGDGPESGFIQREINYDPDLLYNPPPYFPTSGEYEFISWREE
jgi:hypothetical protein